MQKNYESYISTSNGFWRVIHQGLPMCKDFTDRSSPDKEAKRLRLDLSHGFRWDGDIGDWVVDSSV
jgi:hypothetical protein